MVPLRLNPTKEKLMTFPHVPEDLVEALDKMFPNASPDITDADRTIWFKAGAASVVTLLKAKLATQNRDIKERRNVYGT